MSVMTTVDDAEYAVRLAAFASELRRIYRNGGEPSLRDLERALESVRRADAESGRYEFASPISRATISRYLTGKALPRGRFIEIFLEVLDMNRDGNLERLRTLRTAVREAADQA